MKPAYEIVRTDDVDDGDIVIIGPDHIFRQLPPERNPEVLERALRGVVGFVGFLDQDVDFVCSTWIKTAIRELESEAGK